MEYSLTTEFFMASKLKVLIVEDDLMIADMTEELLADGGYDVCGIARTVDEAIDLGARLLPDLALIDFRLVNGGLGTEVATRLRNKSRIGVLYVTGNDAHVDMQAPDGDACLSKPYRSEDLLSGLKVVVGIVATGVAAPPFPRGFRLLRRAYSNPAESSNG
jgi:DNA-binding response OmpR family regulator